MTRIMAAEIAFLGQQLTNTDKVKKIAIFRAFLILKIESKHEAEIMSPFILVIFNIIFFHQRGHPLLISEFMGMEGVHEIQILIIKGQ